jgi:hypothetical protein
VVHREEYPVQSHRFGIWSTFVFHTHTFLFWATLSSYKASQSTGRLW